MNSLLVADSILDDLVVFSVVNFQSLRIIGILTVRQLNHLLYIAINVMNNGKSPGKNLFDKLLDWLNLYFSVFIRPFDLNKNKMLPCFLRLIKLGARQPHLFACKTGSTRCVHRSNLPSLARLTKILWHKTVRGRIT